MLPNPKARLLDQVREVLRVRHYSLRTEQAYIAWIKRFIFFHHKRHPRELGTPDIEAFLTDLAVRQRVSSSTQMQAFNTLIFLYRQVLRLELAPFTRAAPGKDNMGGQVYWVFSHLTTHVIFSPSWGASTWTPCSIRKAVNGTSGRAPHCR
jgi:hypothetical protein